MEVIGFLEYLDGTEQTTGVEHPIRDQKGHWLHIDK
jgi:hypothetical protein